MKNKWISIVICLMLGMTLIGCGSSDKESNSDSGKEEKSVDKDFSIQMTESYTFTDPQDLDFDQRYVLIGDENSKLLSDMAAMDFTATNMYEILYVKDGAAAAEYQFFVTPDEVSATALAEFYSSQGYQITQEGNVLYGYQDGDTIQAAIISFASTGTISDETPEAYIEMMKSFNGLVEY